MIIRRLTIVVVVLAGGCVDKGDEVVRIASPDGRHEAVVVERGAGATTSYWYDVCVVAVGEGCTSPMVSATLYDASRNSSAFGVNVRWVNSFQVVVEYATAANVQRKVPEGMPRDEVRVELRNGVVDANAPPGSMLRELNDGR
jgi:hypothetical protein